MRVNIKKENETDHSHKQTKRLSVHVFEAFLSMCEVNLLHTLKGYTFEDD